MVKGFPAERNGTFSSGELCREPRLDREITPVCKKLHQFEPKNSTTLVYKTNALPLSYKSSEKGRIQ
jgi:hypothetical protein